MHFDLLQSISLAGDSATPNDDRAGVSAGLVWVIDGATDLGPPGLVGEQGGAAWIASEAQIAFTRAADAPIKGIFAIVADQLLSAYAARKTREPKGPWELPLAATLAIRLGDGRLECGWLGDCVGLLRRGDEVLRLGPADDDRAAEIAQAASLSEHGLGNIKRSAPVLADQRARRGRPGTRALGVVPEWMVEVDSFTAACSPGDEILLMTDGFAALVDSYDAYDSTGLMRAVSQHSISALADQLREIEHADSACLRFPRFKISDDATALWLRIGK